MTEYGRFTDEHSLLDLLHRRKNELGLSNERFDEICGFAGGQSDKYIGPTRLKSPSLRNLDIMLTALGFSGSLHIDANKVQRMTRHWTLTARRPESWVRPAGRISKVMVARAKPEVLRQFASMGGSARWKNSTADERAKAVAELNRARLEAWRKKRRSRTGTRR